MIGQLFRLGLWKVKPENSAAFVAAWQAAAEWLEHNLPGERGAVLLEDINDPGRFISYAPISDFAKVEEMMAGAEFQKLMSKVMALCEDVKPHRMRAVGAVGRQEASQESIISKW
jgi:hypothetical protein